MKKFIFGLMLLVSMLEIVGCSMNPSDSDDSVPVDETEYTLINKTVDPLLIAYVSNSGDTKNPKIVAANESYTMKKRDLYIDDKFSCALVYITNEVNQDLTEIKPKIIPAEKLILDEPFVITQEYLKN